MPTYKILHSFRTTLPSNVHHLHETGGHQEQDRKPAAYATLLKNLHPTRTHIGLIPDELLLIIACLFVQIT